MKPSAKDSDHLRLQVYLSRSGHCSRRKAFDLIQAGRVYVNGRLVTEPSTPVNPITDRVSAEGRAVIYKNFDYIVLNKPKGYVTTKSDPHAGKTVYALVPKEYHHLSPAGRLDKDSEGLLLFTNDGGLAYSLTHPKFESDKVYAVTVEGKLTAGGVKKLCDGVNLDGKKTSPAQIAHLAPRGARTAFQMTIHEGRKRQIRRMLESIGHKVVDLKRIQQGPLALRNLKLGEWRKLDADEIKALRK